MKHRFSRQPQSSAEHKGDIFSAHFLRKDSQTVTGHSVLPMHVPVASKEGASPLRTPLLEAQEVTSKDALTYTFLTKRTFAECLKTCRCQNGTSQHTRCILLRTNSCPKVPSPAGKCHLLLLHIEKAETTQHSTLSQQLPLGLHTDLLLQHLPHLITSLLPTYFEKMMMFLHRLSNLDSHLQGPSIPLLTRHRKQDTLFYGTRLHWHTSR